MRISTPLVAVALTLVSLLSASADIVGHMGFRDHMRNARYGEIIIIKGGPFSFTGSVYNTLGLNDCPEAAWKALSPAKIKEQCRADSVFLNGPRYFMMDKSSLANPGNIESFGGLQARHLADVKISLFTLLRGRAKPYTESAVARTTEYVYRAGRPVYELISPKGVVYVMQTYALIVDPNLTEAQLPTLGSKLKLPAGWKFRTRKLDADLTLQVKGTAYVLQDDLENSYQRTNLKP